MPNESGRKSIIISANGSIFYWKKNQNPSEYSVYRVDDQSEVKRSIDDISSYEILNASIEVLNEQISLSTDDLVKASAKSSAFQEQAHLSTRPSEMPFYSDSKITF